VLKRIIVPISGESKRGGVSTILEGRAARGEARGGGTLTGLHSFMELLLCQSGKRRKLSGKFIRALLGGMEERGKRKVRRDRL